MFFQFNPELLKQLQEQAEKQKAKTPGTAEAAGPKYFVAHDGAVVIEDPSLVTVVSVGEYTHHPEDGDNVSF